MPDHDRLLRHEIFDGLIGFHLVRSHHAVCAGTPMTRAIFWPEGMLHVTWRSRLRWGSDVGGVPEAIVCSGRSKSGVEMRASISLLGRTSSPSVPTPLGRGILRS